jgi:AAHS family 3-hydroxyphenylpropionic acid transporter
MMTCIRIDRSWIAIAACFAIALFEGLDIQSMGVAAPKVAPLFQIGPQLMGFVLSASTIGLLIGAAIGGSLSDHVGRRAVLLVSMVLLGICSLATSAATDYQMLIATRFLAGLGLGGVFPCLIALTSELAAPRFRATALAIVYCAMPAGGGVAAWLSGVTSKANWYEVFEVGGAGPIFLTPLVLLCLPNDSGSRPAHTMASSDLLDHANGLFGQNAAATVRLWTAYFFTLFTGYLLLNWLPSMIVGRGFSPHVAAQAALLLNCGAIVGSLVFGRATDTGRIKTTLVGAYAGMVFALTALAMASARGLPLAAFATGFFVIGGQLVLYALASSTYSAGIRGTGVGAAVAVGRLGSVLGPILGGTAIAFGVSSAAMPIIAVPGIVVALFAALSLVSHHVSMSRARVARIDLTAA